MTKLLATSAALAITAFIAFPAPADAAQRNTGIEQTQSTDISAARKHRKHRRHYSRQYYGPRYYSEPYYGYRSYGYDPYYRPYYRPGVSVGVGPFGFGFGL